METVTQPFSSTNDRNAGVHAQKVSRSPPALASVLLQNSTSSNKIRSSFRIAFKHQWLGAVPISSIDSPRTA